MAAIGYTYSGGRLSQLDRKTYRSGAAQHQYYNFAYNVWGQTTATKVGSRTLSTNTYYNYVNDDTARGGARSRGRRVSCGTDFAPRRFGLCRFYNFRTVKRRAARRRPAAPGCARGNQCAVFPG